MDMHVLRYQWNAAMTPLDRKLQRQLLVDDQPYTLTLDPNGLKLAEKGKRNGIELRWIDIVNGDAGLAAALQASLGK